MLVTILNGNPLTGNRSFDSYLGEIARILESGGHDVRLLTLRDMNICYCTGCWGCWVKTPGECVVRDDSREVCRAVIGSALTLFASPLIMGFTSELLKRTTDKLIPLVRPHLAYINGEIHHEARYDSYPEIALLVEPGPDCDDLDFEIVSDIYRRMAINLHSRLKFARKVSSSATEVADEISAL